MPPPPPGITKPGGKAAKSVVVPNNLHTTNPALPPCQEDQPHQVPKQMMGAISRIAKEETSIKCNKYYHWFEKGLIVLHIVAKTAKFAEVGELQYCSSNPNPTPAKRQFQPLPHALQSVLHKQKRHP
jgi:hypothetical protein